MPSQPTLAELADDRTESVDRGARLDPLLASFVVEHNDRLIRLAYLICNNAADAADAVQRGFEQAWRRRSTLRSEATLRPWLDRVVVREAIRITRRPWYRRLVSLDSRIAWIDPAASAVDSDVWLALRVAVDRLPAEQRHALVLHLHAGYSVAETAELVGVPLETVRSRLRVAKERLRRELREPVR
jgi:RNA polymerase sigma-70 factor, ECF subfamily